MKSKTKGSDGFGPEYWGTNYADPDDMDGIGNAVHHAGYLKQLFDLELVDISTVADFGFGLGHLFEAVLKEFVPYRALGLEPSKTAFDLVSKRGIKPVDSTKLVLKQMDLATWAREQTPKSRWYDLGLCTSVFQYLTEEELSLVVPVLASKVKYLYMSVPTDKELKRQRTEMEFNDLYAYRRSRSFYLKLLKPHFTIISSRLLESRVFFDEDKSFFTDYLYRF